MSEMALSSTASALSLLGSRGQGRLSSDLAVCDPLSWGYLLLPHMTDDLLASVGCGPCRARSRAGPRRGTPRRRWRATPAASGRARGVRDPIRGGVGARAAADARVRGGTDRSGSGATPRLWARDPRRPQPGWPEPIAICEFDELSTMPVLGLALRSSLAQASSGHWSSVFRCWR